MSRTPRPPRLAVWLLALRRLGDRRADVEADVLELFHARAASDGVRVARRRYYRDVLSILRSEGPKVARSEGRSMRGRTSGPSDRRTLEPRSHHVATILRDVSYATRLFRRHPVLVTVVVFGLAIGIGVATAAFTYLKAGLYRDYGLTDPDAVVRLVRVHGKSSWVPWLPADAEQLVGRPTLSTLVVTAEGGQATVGRTAADEAAMGFLEFVGPGFFPVMGGRIAAGRTLGPADDAPADVPAVVLSHAYWTRGFGADSGIVGTQISVNGLRVVVVGVMDRTFSGPSGSPISVWLPIGAWPRIHGAAPNLVTILGRLAPQATVAQAESELTSLSRGLIPASDASGNDVTERVWLRPAGRPVWSERDVPKLWMMVLAVGGIVGLILLLACANATNLLLASALSRRREIGVRLALGASRGRLVRQLITESVLLSAAAAAVGLVLAGWLVQIIALQGSPEPGVDPSIDVRVYLFVVAMVFVVGVGAGLAPARHGTRGDFMTPLKGESGGATGGAASRPTALAARRRAGCGLMPAARRHGAAGARGGVRRSIRSRHPGGSPARGITRIQQRVQRPRTGV